MQLGNLDENSNYELKSQYFSLLSKRFNQSQMIIQTLIFTPSWSLGVGITMVSRSMISH